MENGRGNNNSGEIGESGEQVKREGEKEGERVQARERGREREREFPVSGGVLLREADQAASDR